MKKLFLLTLTAVGLFGCLPSLDKARQIKVGMLTCQLKDLMGEPQSIEVNPGREVWYYSYDNMGGTGFLHIDISDSKITNFYSY